MDIKNITCPVEAEEGFGEYANAFRILSAGGNDLFLDFCVYSEHSHKAKVVARVRCTPDLLEVVRNRIVEARPAPEPPDSNQLYFVLPGPLGDN